MFYTLLTRCYPPPPTTPKSRSQKDVRIFSASTSLSFRRTSDLPPVTHKYKRVNWTKATRSDREMKRKYNRITLHLARSPWGSHRRNPTNTRHTIGVISHSTYVVCIPNACCGIMRSSLEPTLNRCRQKSVIATKPRIWVTAVEGWGGASAYRGQKPMLRCSGHKTKLSIEFHSVFFYYWLTQQVYWRFIASNS